MHERRSAARRERPGSTFPGYRTLNVDPERVGAPPIDVAARGRRPRHPYPAAVDVAPRATAARAAWRAGTRRRRRSASRSAGASSTCAPAPRTSAAARARAARTSSATAVRASSPSVSGARGRERLQRRVGRAGHDHGVAAGEHRHRLHQRPRGRLLEQVAEHEHERPLGALRRAGTRARSRRRRGAAAGRTASARPRRRAARPGRDAKRTPSSKAIAPKRSPTSSATSATAVSASRQASSTVGRAPPGAGSGAADSRPASTTAITSRSCSIRYWLLIGRPSRAVARQLTWRTSSSGR